MSVKNHNSGRITKLSNVGAIVSIISVHPSNLLHIRRIGWNGLDMISALGMFSGCIQGVQRLDSLVTECGFLFVRSCTIYKGARTNAQKQSADFGLCCISYDCYNSC